MDFWWGLIIVVLLIIITWVTLDRRAKRGDASDEGDGSPKADESWTLDSAEDTAHDHEGE